jgi:hypothetical protein
VVLEENPVQLVPVDDQEHRDHKDQEGLKVRY